MEGALCYNIITIIQIPKTFVLQYCDARAQSVKSVVFTKE